LAELQGKDESIFSLVAAKDHQIAIAAEQMTSPKV